jgi:hypothetical protein
MQRRSRKISRVDRIALAATFAVTTMILVMFGFTARAAMQPVLATPFVMALPLDPCEPAATPVGSD